MSNEKVKHKTSIGGQALIEGVMMRGVDSSAMALRLPTGEIELEKWDIKGGKSLPWYRKIPILRGCFNFVSSMVEGYKCLMKSAQRAADFEEEDDEEPSKFEKWLDENLGDKIMPVLTVIAMILGCGIAVFLFVFLPTFLINKLDSAVNVGNFKALLEGVLKVVILVIYLWITSKMKEMKRTYQYHGAEHKTIACYEACEEMTVENVRKMRRFHPRCGTSFLLIVLIVGILVFSFVTVSNVWLRVAFRFLTLPLIVGISYEIIKIAGRYDNIFTRIISAPGLGLQRITTNEPDDSQIEVALKAFIAVAPEDKESDKW